MVTVPLPLMLLLPKRQHSGASGAHRRCWASGSPAARLPVGSSFLPAPPWSQFLTGFSAVLQSPFRSTSLKKAAGHGPACKRQRTPFLPWTTLPHYLLAGLGTPGPPPKPGTRCLPSVGRERLALPRRDRHCPVHHPPPSLGWHLGSEQGSGEKTLKGL